MVRQAHQQRLPSAGPEREALRETGRFWTPSWVAEAMVGYVLQGKTNHVFDPAVGSGAFFRAAKVIGQQLHRNLSLLGSEIDPKALAEALLMGLSPDDLAGVRVGDFVLHPPARSFHAIVANQPYIRHHRLAAPLKVALKEYSKRVLGTPLDGRAGLHFYFFMRALELLDPSGRLAIIVPADTCEGKSAPALWAWIVQHYRIDAAVTFAPDATPFPGVDTNAIIFMIRRAKPSQTILWAQCTRSRSEQLKEWTLSRFRCAPNPDLTMNRRQLREALTTGLSRPPIVTQTHRDDATLADFATTMRGIATGANEFFFLT
ncbi:MAG: HsdM family class I SAM-dependent methyltransferase, partial [Ktedonobacterales bacterium]